MSKQPTSADVAKRLERARAECTTAAQDVAAAQHVLENHLLAGEKDLVVQRSQNLLADAKARQSACDERVRLLERAYQEALTREQGEERAAKIRSADDVLVHRTKAAAELESAATILAQAFVAFRQLSIDAMEQLPERLRNLPPLFVDQFLTTQLQIRLMALTDGKLVAPRVGLSVWEAQQQPTLSERAAAERETVMSYYATPPAAKAPRNAA